MQDIPRVEIPVSVTKEHFDRCPDLGVVGADDNPVSVAILEALQAEGSPFAERLSGFDRLLVDLLSQGDEGWRVDLCAVLPKPWDNYARLLWWNIDDPDEVAWIDTVMHELEARPFEFVLSWY